MYKDIEYCIHNDFILLQGHLGLSGEAGVTAVRHVREVPHYAGDNARMEMTARAQMLKFNIAIQTYLVMEVC